MSSEGDAESPESARLAVVDCEREIQQIKAGLRKFGSDNTASSEDAPNSLTVVWTGITTSDGNNNNNDEVQLGEGIDVSLQLSSPIEEAVLQPPGSNESAEEESSSSKTTFQGVETSVATLTATLRKKGGEILGNSESYDLAPLCKLEDAMNPKDEYVTELAVAIVSPEEFAKKPTATTQREDEKEAEEEGAEPKEEGEKEEEKPKEESPIIKPMCTLTLKIVYKPSAKDQKEELYELLNKAHQRKSQALGKLRGAQQSSSGEMSKTSSTGGGANNKKQGAVKAGFLNKKPKKPEEGKFKQLYNKYLGPNSMARVVFPIAKNYIIFFGAVVICHFKGDMMALPAPV